MSKNQHHHLLQGERDSPIYARLKERHRNEREHYESPWGENFSLRIHRALSWLRRAEKSADDLDIRFIALWVAFNAAYAGEIGGQIAGRSTITESASFTGFLNKLVRLDTAGKIAIALRQHGSGPVRLLLENKYIYQPFWDCQNEVVGAESWRERFRQEKIKANAALMGQDATLTLQILFERLYTLRNQIVHGGATWDSSTNRSTLTDASRILLSLLEVMLEIMLNNGAEFASAPFYPPTEI